MNYVFKAHDKVQVYKDTIILKGSKWSKWHLTTFCYLCQTCSSWKWIPSL